MANASFNPATRHTTGDLHGPSFPSPIGTFVHPWITKADTKFNADGLFHSDLDVSAEAASNTMEAIRGAAEAALAEHTDKMSPAQAKKWSVYLPFEELEDEETGEPTGTVRFQFKQNAKIKTRDGNVKQVSIEVRDGADKVVSIPVFNGDKGRIMFSMRPIVIAQSMKAGVRLDFYKVQVTEKGSGSSQGFGAVDGAYVADDRKTSDDYEGPAEGGNEEGGDY